MTAQELRETGQKLFREKQYAAAARLLVSAVEASPQDEQVWQELVLGFSWSGEHDKSADFVKQAVRAYPRSDWLWRQLGSELITLDRLEEAGNALQNAKGLNLNAPWLWRYLATLHEKQSDNAKEIEAWENLGELEELDSNELNKLGIAYYKLGNFGKALGLYRRSAAKSPSAAAYFNMGLVYNHAEFSQDADAADACRRALALTPTFQEAINPLEATKQKLLPLAERARSEAGVLVQRDNYFRFYLNPFEVLPIALDGSLDELGDKAIQRATKKLLAEIRLNDGRVEWLEGHAIDESRALALADEICDAKKQRFHRTIFDNHPLLRFLTRGEIEHFLYSDEYFPKEVLELWDHEPEFRGFISKPFARQYNFVLSLAIQGRVLAVVEAMFDGRRWVEQARRDADWMGKRKATERGHHETRLF
jgi:tetratricopeptide (TPR) repeat protein